MRSLLHVCLADDVDLTVDADRILAAGADVVVVDVVDVSDQALAAACSFLQQTRTRIERPQIYARIPVLDDPAAISILDTVIGAGADGIVLPDVAGGHDVTRLDARISVEEAVHAVDHGRVRIIAEAAGSARAVMGLASLRGASHRLAGLIWKASHMGGISVLTPEGRLRAPLAAARGQFLVAAYAAGVVPIIDSSAHRPGKDIGERYRSARNDGFAAGLTRDIAAIGEIAAIMAAAPG
jgi:citrate lyase subunit beta/citryl-CoA lyase